MTYHTVPEGWKKVPFAECIDKNTKLKYGKVKKTDYLDNGDIPVIDQGQDFIAGFTDDKDMKFPGRLPVTIFGDHTLIVKYVEKEFAVGADGTVLLYPYSQILTNKYFYYLVSDHKIKSEGYQRHFKYLKEKIFIIPPLSEQRKVVAILSTVDGAIEKTEAIIEETKKLKKGLMQKLFTEGIGHTRIKETKIGRIPEEWDVVRFSELLEDGIISKIQDGNHGELHPKSSDFVDEGIPFIMASNVVNGGINLKNCYFISREQAESLRVGFSIKNDILLTHKGSVGNVAIVPEIEDFIMLTPQVTLYRIPEENRLLRLFLRYYFESMEFQKTLKRLSMQSTRAYIGISAQKKLWIYLPRIKEQQQITQILSGVDTKIENELDFKKQLEQFKKGLMQVLLTGKVRVKV